MEEKEIKGIYFLHSRASINPLVKKKLYRKVNRGKTPRKENRERYIDEEQRKYRAKAIEQKQ